MSDFSRLKKNTEKPQITSIRNEAGNTSIN